MGAIRLVPDEPPRALSIDRARSAANDAYSQARNAQRKLVSRLVLMDLLYRPGPVSHARLRGELTEAREQCRRATRVVDALTTAIEALEAADPKADA